MRDWPFPNVYGSIPTMPKPKTSIKLLCDWVNTHDCGVSPTGVVLGDSVVVRVSTVSKDGSYGVEETAVKTLQQARMALGY